MSSVVRQRDGTTTVTLKSDKPELNGLVVRYDNENFPDLTPHLYQGGVNTVEIKMTGNRKQDFAAANKLAGFGDKARDTPANYLWHHHQDLGVMQLVRKDVHALVPHSGSVSIWQQAMGMKYD